MEMSTLKRLVLIFFSFSAKLASNPCSLHYKHMTIVNDDPSIVIKWSSKLIDVARGVIYDHHMFIVQATDLQFS